ncbi:MAG: NAD-dependent epimerase/dehydratase family protein, partial [Acidimicrobiales bacterium]
TAIVAALDAPTGYYNVADEPVTKGRWNEAFFEAFDIAKKPRPLPTLLLKAGGAKAEVLAGSRRITSQKFREATGWEPTYPDATIGLKAIAATYDRGQR